MGARVSEGWEGVWSRVCRAVCASMQSVLPITSGKRQLFQLAGRWFCYGGLGAWPFRASSSCLNQFSVKNAPHARHGYVVPAEYGSS